MKLFLLGAAGISAGSLLIDFFAKEMSQNQLISIAGLGVISSVLYFVIVFEETVRFFLNDKRPIRDATEKK